MGIIGVILWLIGVVNFLLSPHDPPSRGYIGLMLGLEKFNGNSWGYIGIMELEWKLLFRVLWGM